MEEWVLILLPALLGGLLGAWLTYVFGLRRDKEERRRERVVAHLIEAYRNLENVAGRDNLTGEQKDRLETSVAAIFLLGSKAAAEAANLLAKEVADGNGNMKHLLKIMRSDLRKELGLPQHDVDTLFLRMWREEGNKE
ncbi:MAG: hypothetical protein GY945_13960, partial [Rhodobacteraceae bacterium]|nr:hypothetical protein [Paracoccaceae bacterium]